MRTGINLASRPHRGADVSPVVRWLPFITLLALTALHVYAGARAQRGLAGERAFVLKNEAELESLAREETLSHAALASDSRQKALLALAAFERAGAPDRITTSAVLSEVAKAFPRDARVLSFSLHFDREPPQVSLDVAASDPEAASELALALSRSALLENPELVDEKTLEAGDYRFRITAEVRRKRASK